MPYILTITMQLISHFRYWLLFPAVVFEGPIATIIAGFLSAHGQLNFLISFVVVIIADTLADLGYYALGAFGGASISERFKARLGITDERLATLQASFHSHGWKAFLTGKVLHGPGVAVLIAAGAARYPLVQYLIFNVGITLVKSFILLLIGYYFGQALELFQQFLDISALLVSGIVIILGIKLYLTYRRRKKKHENLDRN